MKMDGLYPATLMSADLFPLLYFSHRPGFYPPATYATLTHKIFWEYQDMSKIEIDGFLSNEADEGRNLILNSYREAFVLAKDLN